MAGMIGTAGLGIMALAALRMEQVEREGGEWLGDAWAPTPREIAERRRAATVNCNVSEEERAERDRPKSRQERRQMARLARKGRA